MSNDNKNLFKNILQAFLDKYSFEIPKLLAEETTHNNTGA
jgi:hypothetical protein